MKNFFLLLPLWAATAYSMVAQTEQKNQPGAFDILHTSIELKFNPGKQYAYGIAVLTVTPYSTSLDGLTLDAKGMEIKSVCCFSKRARKRLTYNSLTDCLVVNFIEKLQVGDTVQLEVQYTAKPYERKLAANTNERGLYFINPTGALKDVPFQIWTQGEPEYNSVWYPTTDAPHEKFTSEISLTVDTQYMTVSNGVCDNQRVNGDGTRTDHWKLDKPQSAYLLGFVVGDFDAITDTIDGRKFTYLVEKGYGSRARTVFGETGAMIRFFEEKFGVPFVWGDYKQVVIHGFESGAMENTTCVTFLHEIQQDSIEVHDRDMSFYVPHELSHHWFGDLVTMANWDNLALNESLATFAEYMWYDNRYGSEEANRYLEEDIRQRYFREAQGKWQAIVRSDYTSPDELFDAHRYEKGACVLYMLENLIGNEAFLNGLKHYLQIHAFGTAIIPDLREVFEATSGKDLGWFFEQWFYRSGHPKIDVTYELQQDRMIVNTAQASVGSDQLFILPTEVVVTYTDGSKQSFPLFLGVAKTRDTLTLMKSVSNIEFDPKRVLLAEITEIKPTIYWQYQLENGTTYPARRAAIWGLTSIKTNSTVIPLLAQALRHDPDWAIRRMAAGALLYGSDSTNYRLLEIVANAALKERNPKTLSAVLACVIKGIKGTNGSESSDNTLWRRLADWSIAQSSYAVRAQGLVLLQLIDPSAATLEADLIRQSAIQSENLLLACATVLMKNRPCDIETIITLLDRIQETRHWSAVLEAFADYLRQPASEPVRAWGLSWLQRRVQNALYADGKQAGIKALLAFRDQPGVKTWAKAMINNPAQSAWYESLKQFGDKAIIISPKK